MNHVLTSTVALVAGGTRGASRAIAVELGRAGATVYVTGRSSEDQRSEVNRPETIEGTVELIEQAGGTGYAIGTDHLDPEQVRRLADRVDSEQGKLDILVDGIWGGDSYMEWGKPVWEHSLEAGLRMLRLGIDAHIITAHFLLPLVVRQPGGLVVELTDGTAEYNATYREGTTLAFYLAKATAHLMAIGEAAETGDYGCTAVALTPGWLRSEAMLDIFGVTEENWQEGARQDPHFIMSESPAFIGRAVAALAADPEKIRHSGQTFSSGQLANMYSVNDIDGSRPDFFRYAQDIVHAGKPADPTGYR